ncbi:MAG TPA: phage minor head protein [Lelliottia sp.]|jgi:SPP1 gp7 family putative phage head morphogenesis protein
MAETKKTKQPKQGKKNKKEATRWLYPESVNIDYQSVLFSSLDDWFKKINEQLSQAQIPLDFLSSISTLSYLSANFGADAINELAGFFKQVAISNDGFWVKMVKIGTNTDLAPAEVNYAPGDSVIVGDTTGIDVYRSEPWLREMQTTWVQENTQLIKSIPKQHLDDVAKITQQAVDEGWRIEKLRKAIQDRFHVPENRAVLIATDQIGKANSAVSMQRMRDYGIRKYKWRGAMDSRERKEHVDREGEEFDIDHPPEDGPPGYPIRCRCWPEPVWDIAA